jgi:hypothetical protein
MSTPKPALECPKCEIEVAYDAQYCPVCGFEFLGGREGVGPVHFTHPAVGSSFDEPLTEDRLIVKLAMLMGGLLAAIIIPPLGYLLEIGVTALAAKFSTLLGVIAMFVIFGVIPGVMGWGISHTIGTIAYKNTYRNTKATATIGAVAGIVGSLVYFGCWYVYLVFLRSKPGFHPGFWDYVIWIWHLLLITGLAWAGSNEKINANPLCMNCKKYLKTKTFGKWHSKHEGEFLNALETHNMDALSTLAGDSSLKNYTNLTLHTCDQCQAGSHYVSAKSIQFRNTFKQDGTVAAHVEERQIYFAKIGQDEASKLLVLAETVAN